MTKTSVHTPQAAVPEPSPSDWLTTKEAADQLGIDTRSVRQLIADEKLLGVLLPTGRWYVYQPSVDTLALRWNAETPADQLVYREERIFVEREPALLDPVEVHRVEPASAAVEPAGPIPARSATPSFEQRTSLRAAPSVAQVAFILALCFLIIGLAIGAM